MRKVTLLLTMVAFASFAFAQKGFVPQKMPVKASPDLNKEVQAKKQMRAPGDSIAYFDFNEADWGGTNDNGTPVADAAPAGWTIGDDSGEGFYWRWTDQGPRGAWTGEDGCEPAEGGMNSSSGDNGWLTLEADYFNTDDACNMVEESLPMDSYVQYDDGVDFSDYQQVRVVVQQMNRFCCAAYSSTVGAFFGVQLDGETEWIDFNIADAPINDGVGNTNTGEVYFSEVDLTQHVAGEANVKFRFYMTGLSHYHWEIDDVLFMVPEEYDMESKDYWNDYLVYRERADINYDYSFTEGFYQYPWFMMQDYVGFHLAYQNVGTEPRENFQHKIDIMRGDDVLESYTSDPITVAPGEGDTTFIDGVSWTPDDIGLYKFVHYPVADETEARTSNDTLTRDLKVSNSILTPVNWDARNGRIEPDNWTNYEGDGWGLGFEFTLPEVDVHGETSDYYILNGVQFYVATDSDSDADNLALFENEQAVAEVVLYSIDYSGESAVYTEIISSVEHVMTIDDTASTVYVPFDGDGSSEFIHSGNNDSSYMVQLKMYGTYTDEYDRVQTWSVGNVNYTVQKNSPEASLLIAPDPNDNAGFTSEGPMIGLDIDFTGGPAFYDVSFEVQDSDGNLLDSATIELMNGFNELTDVNGAASFQLKEGAYDYTLTRDDYDEVTGSIDVSSDTIIEVQMTPDAIGSQPKAEFNVYPNPTKGAFTLEAEGQSNVTIMNAAGQVVESMTINGTQTINLDVNTGVYFVRVQNNDKVGMKQLVVE